MADPDYFTLAEFRTLPDMDDAVEYTEAKVLAAAAHFTTIVEREVGVPFIPRTYTETLSGAGTTGLALAHTPTELTSVTLNGTTVDVSRLDFTSGVLRYTSTYGPGTAWGPGVGNVVVTYTAGAYDECPADVKNAVMWATRDRLLGQADQAGIDIRKTSVTTDFGTTSYILPGEKRPTGYPELDALIASYIRSDSPLGIA